MAVFVCTCCYNPKLGDLDFTGCIILPDTIRIHGDPGERYINAEVLLNAGLIWSGIWCKPDGSAIVHLLDPLGAL